jgi:hypothetical protein
MPTTSANMGLTVPTPSTGVTGTGDSGPGYATNISNDLNTIDTHDHSSGKGVQVTPAGLNINADLSFGSNNAKDLRSVRFTSQASALAGASDVGEVYVKSGDLWYVNSSGVQVQVTAGSAIATGPTGGIGPQGPAGLFSGMFYLPTATWQPTGSFSGTYKVVSWASTLSLSSGTFTGTLASYVITPNRGTVISVVANILGYDGYANAAEADLKGTYIGPSGTVGTPGTVTGVGTFTTCYLQNSPVASGWGFILRPTGSQISVMASVGTGGWSGTTNFLCTMQVTERGNP